jgi:hypothetical protein
MNARALLASNQAGILDMNRLQVLAGLIAALAALPAGRAVSAELYKWVDERGVVNYSNQMPADPVTASSVNAVGDRVSVYSPDAALTREIEADRERARRAVQEKPEVHQPAVTMLGAPAPSVPPTVYESYPVVYPYWVGPGLTRRRHRPLSSVRQIKLPPGATAGAMLGPNTLVPGTTSFVPGKGPTIVEQPAPLRPR